MCSLAVLFVYDAVYPHALGGVEHRNHELGRALAERGHRVTLAGFADGDAVPFPGGRVLPIGKPRALHRADSRRRLAPAALLAAAACRLDLRPYDVVEAANIPYLHLFPLAARCALARRPLLVTWYEHWGAHWRRAAGWTWPLFAFTERRCAGLGREAVAVSALTARRLQARRRRPVAVFPVGIPLTAVRAAAAGAPAGPPLVYAGRLIADKRLDLLLEAVARLPASGSPLLAILGEGPDRARLEALARRLAVSERVLFRGRLETSAEVWRAVAGARVAVQPSAREGFGLFPLEAMAAGLPVVHCSSGESAVGELVRHDIEGLETPPEPEALAAGLAALLADEPRRRRLADAARRRAQDYDWPHLAARFEDLLVRLAAARPRRSPRRR